MIPKENNASMKVDQVLEMQLETYYSAYKAKPSFKQALQSQLNDEIKYKFAGPGPSASFEKVFHSSIVKWATVGLAFVLLGILSFAIAPVRNAIGKALDIGYIDGVGFVKISETYVLNGSIVSERVSQVIVIDRVVMDSNGTTVWFHLTGDPPLWRNTEGKPIAYLEAENQHYPVRSWGWDEISQSGLFEFSASTLSASSVYVLHIQPDWVIPIHLTPMSENADEQAIIIFPDLCQSRKGVELCVQAFVNDSTGYHLLLNASSSNPDFYLESLDLTNLLTGEDAQLIDSSGNRLQKGSTTSPSFPIPFEIPVEVFDYQRKASTSLTYSSSTPEGDFLTLVVPGLTVKTPTSQTITCNLDNGLVIGSTFPCEASVTIGGNVLNFHTGEVHQGQTGIQLRITSEPIQPKDNLLVTSVSLENLNGVDSTIGTSFEVKTRQLSLFLEQETYSSGQSFNIRIVDGYLTILEPYQFNWTINP